MSKQRIKRLAMVLKMAEDKEQQDLQSWGRCQQKLEEERNKITQLEGYMTDYRNTLTSSSQNLSIQGGQVQNTIAFIEQIKDACGHQEQQVNLVEQQAEAAKRVYLESRTKAEALRKLIVKLSAQEKSVADKAEQKLMDEFAARSARNRTF